jgi:hypothetical protein
MAYSKRVLGFFDLDNGRVFSYQQSYVNFQEYSAKNIPIAKVKRAKGFF